MKHTSPLKLALSAGLAFVCFAGAWSALHATLVPTNYPLRDNITGGSGSRAGKGNINVFATKTVTLSGQDLEAFRVQSTGGGTSGQTLRFAVDVNENSSGLETSRAQGVAIKSAKLVVVRPSGTSTYDKFWTQTQALVAEAGSTTRQLRYTLLGDSGSNEITGRKISSTVYDSTLAFDVPQSVADATSVTLVIELLTTDPNRGEPENFFDFTGGFEDLALITLEQAKIYDVYVPHHPSVGFLRESPGTILSPEGIATLSAVAGTTYTDTATGATYVIPPDLVSNALLGDLGAAGYQIVAFEDEFPSTGDYDFNDVVAAHRIQTTLNSSGQVVAISGDAYLVARGAGGYNHRWNLDIPLSQSGVDVGQFICNVTKNSTSPEIGNSHTINSQNPLACLITSAPGSTGSVLRIVGFRDTRELLPSMNTLSTDTPSLGSVPHVTFSIALSTPIAVAAIGSARPWIEIGRSTSPMSPLSLSGSYLEGMGTGTATGLYKVDESSRDPQNKPYAMAIPADWQVPIEGTDIGLAYPSFTNFVTTGGASSKTWYQAPDPRKVVQWKVRDVAQ